MRTLLSIAAALALLYLVLLLAAWRLQERIVWQPPPPVAPRAGVTASRLDFAADDGQPLQAWLVGDPARAPGLLVVFHGNADLAVWQLPWAAEVERRTGWAVLVPEYRGYGGLPGTPGYEGSRRDALATWRLARDTLGVEAARIALYGHSLGSAIAAELAADAAAERPSGRAPAALVLVAPFTSAREMAREMLAAPVAALWGAIGRVHFDTRARVARLDVPVWVAHGARDAAIPARMGRAVHAAARVPGELLMVPDAGHNDLLAVDAAAYWGWLGRALAAASPSR